MISMRLSKVEEYANLLIRATARTEQPVLLRHIQLLLVDHRSRGFEVVVEALGYCYVGILNEHPNSP